MKQVATSIVDDFEDRDIQNSTKNENLKKQSKILPEYQIIIKLLKKNFYKH